MNASVSPASLDDLGVTREEAIAERERLYQLLERDAQTALDRCGRVERHFVLQGRPLTLRFAGNFLERAMCRALAHLAVETAPAAPELVIDCWDCARSGLEFPMPRWPAKYWTARGEIMGLDSAEGRLAYFGWLKLLNAYFPATGRAFYCLAAADPFPLQQAGSPALTIFNWWWETLGFQLVHSAAVGNEKGGVLIAGHGGAGKSTLAFSTFGTPAPVSERRLLPVARTAGRGSRAFCQRKTNGTIAGLAQPSAFPSGQC